jgi:stromal membrane-associated protein
MHATQVMKEYGNVRSNAHYHPDEKKHPPPTNMMESERDSELEQFIRGSSSSSIPSGRVA